MRPRLKRSGEAFAALWRPIADETARQRRNNLTSGLILCNAIFCAIAGACWLFEVQSNVEEWPYISFFIGEGILIMVYRSNAWYSRTIAKNIRQNFSSLAPASDSASVADPPPPEGLAFPLQAIGTLNAMLVGFLTYFTGGPSNSPYAQVLVAMLLIAEQTRNVKDRNHEDRIGHMIKKAIREFAWFFALTAVFYVPLGLLQWRYPVTVATAPAEATIIITAIIFLVGSVTNYLSGSSRDIPIFGMMPKDPDDDTAESSVD